MAEKGYSAGTIFLQVVPSFRGFQDAIREEVRKTNKDIGDKLGQSPDIDKSVEQAGTRAGRILGASAQKSVGKVKIEAEVDDKAIGKFERDFKAAMLKMQRELRPIKPELESKEFQRDFAVLKRTVDTLSRIDVGVHMTSREAEQKATELIAMVERLKKAANSIEARMNVGEAIKGVERISVAIKKVDGQTIAPKVEVAKELEKELKKADAQIGAFAKNVHAKLKKATESLGDGVSQQVEVIKTKLDTLRDVHIGVDLTATEFLYEVGLIDADLRRLDSTEVDVTVKADIATALAHLSEVYLIAHKVGVEDPNIQVHADTAEADAKMVKTGFLARILGQTSPRIQVKVDNAKANAGLLQTAFLSKLLNRDSNDTANSFRAFSGVLLLASTMGAALIPILAAVAAGIIALGPALISAVAGFGVFLIVIIPVVKALQALSAQSKTSAKDTDTAAKQIKSAAQAVEDAERSLTRARQDAARSAADAARAVVAAKRSEAAGVQSALDQERSAQEAYARSVQTVQQAEANLRAARAQAQQQQLDLKNQIKQNAIDQRNAIVELFDATVAYRAIQNDGSATELDRYQALTRLQQARLTLKESRQQGDSLKKTQANPSSPDNPRSAVDAAQQALLDAIQQQKDAQLDLKRAEAGVVKARIDGARQVADAYRQQRRTAVDNAQAIGDAQRNLQRAQETYQDTLHTTGDIGSASMRNVKEAMDNLTPAGRRFVRFLWGMKDSFKGLQEAADPIFGGMTYAIRKLTEKHLPGLRNYIHRMSGAISGLFRDLADALTGKEFSGFFRMMNRFGPVLLRNFGDTIIEWMKFFARLMQLTTPFAVRLSDAMLNISRNATKWLDSSKGTKTWRDFMAYAARVGPDVAAFFVALWEALVNIGVALAPIGEVILGALTYVLDFIASMDPDTLRLFLGALLGIIAAFQIITAVLVVIANPLLLVIIAVAALTLGIIYAYQHFETFRDIVDGAWEVLKTFWGLIVRFKIPLLILAGVIGGLLFPFGLLVAVVIVAYKKFELFRDIVHIFWTAFKLYIGFFIDYWKTVGKVFLWVYDHTYKYVFMLWIALVKFAWNNVIKPIFGYIADKFKTMGNQFKWVYDHIIQPAFDALVTGLRGVRDRVSTIVDAIGVAWDVLRGLFQSPISFVIDTVLNGGLIKAFNWLADNIPGLPSIPNIPNPFTGGGGKKPPAGGGTRGQGGHTDPTGFASGGVYNPAFGAMGYRTGGTPPIFNRDGLFHGVRPGYTPGRDTHVIAVGGGEAIMRPEWTKAILQYDPTYIDRMNELARNGGVEAVRRYMGAFSAPRVPSRHHYAKGGVVGDYERLTWRGHQFDGMTVKLLLDAERRLGQMFSISQGSFSNAVAASGGTHAGGGAVDIGSPWTVAAVAALRTAGIGDGYGGFAAWQRNPSQGPWNNHIHGIVVGDDLASDGAKSQVASYLNGGNGLGGADDGPQVGLANLFGRGGGLGDTLSGIGHGVLHIGQGIVGFAKGVYEALSDPIGYIEDQLKKPLGELEEKFGGKDSMIVKAVEAIPPYVLDQAKDWITGLASDVIGGIGGLLGPAGGNPRGANLPGPALGNGSPEMRQMIDDMAASTYGWTGAQTAALNNLVASESSFRADAQNPTSTAYGLFQFLDGTWATVGGYKTDDPRQQTIFGLRYIAQRYNDPVGAWNFHLTNGYYKDGGVVPEDAPAPVTMYDNGGYLPPGLTTVLNLTGSPEPVFTADQFDAMKRGGGGGHTVNVHAQTNASPHDIGEQVLFAFRRADAGGVHAGGRI